METERDITKEDFVLENVNLSGKKEDILEKEILAGKEDVMCMVDTFICVITENTSENIVLLWRNLLGVVLSQANTFTTRTALRMITELKTLRSLMRESISQCIGSSKSYRPALEPITVARKPLSEKTVAENVLKWEQDVSTLMGVVWR